MVSALVCCASALGTDSNLSLEQMQERVDLLSEFIELDQSIPATHWDASDYAVAEALEQWIDDPDDITDDYIASEDAYASGALQAAVDALREYKLNPVPNEQHLANLQKERDALMAMLPENQQQASDAVVGALALGIVMGLLLGLLLAALFALFRRSRTARA